MSIVRNFTKSLLIVSIAISTSLHSPQRVTNAQRELDKHVHECPNKPQNGTSFDPKVAKLADDEVADLTKALPYKPRRDNCILENPFRAIKVYLPMQDTDGNRTYEYIGCACSKQRLKSISKDSYNNLHNAYFSEPSSLIIFSYEMLPNLSTNTHLGEYHAYMYKSPFEFAHAGSFYAQAIPENTFIDHKVIISEEIYKKLNTYNLIYQPTKKLLPWLMTEELNFEPLAIKP